jgi:hypothetical protein
MKKKIFTTFTKHKINPTRNNNNSSIKQSLSLSPSQSPSSNSSSSIIPFGQKKFLNNPIKNKSIYKLDSLKSSKFDKTNSLKFSAQKNYNKNDFFNDGKSESKFQNYRTINEELKKGNKLFNKIMSADRKGHIIRIMESFDREHIDYGTNIPLDMHLRKYFLKFKFIKNQDREFISNQVYNIIRYKGLIDFLTKKPLNWLGRFDTFYSQDFERQKFNVNIPV